MTDKWSERFFPAGNKFLYRSAKEGRVLTKSFANKLYNIFRGMHWLDDGFKN